jgi:hypothetical protein
MGKKNILTVFISCLMFVQTAAQSLPFQNAALTAEESSTVKKL